MLVRKLSDIDGSDRDIRSETWKSRRLLLASDGRGYSLHDTILYAGTETTMEYANHIESVYCIEGKGRLLDLVDGDEHVLEAGTLYVLDGHERHQVVAETDLRMICVFTPPVTGNEVHDENGAYPLVTEGASS